MYFKAWLNYDGELNENVRDYFQAVFSNYESNVFSKVNRQMYLHAMEEVKAAANSFLGKKPDEYDFIMNEENFTVIEEKYENTEEQKWKRGILLYYVPENQDNEESLSTDGAYEIKQYLDEEKRFDLWTVRASGGRGILYGTYALIRQAICDGKLTDTGVVKPSLALRMLNHWDNLDGSIERGYSGNSFFFSKNQILVDERTAFYARLLASVGINGVVINNVNVKDMATRLISPLYYAKLREMSELFAGYGIQLFMSLNFAAPMELGGLSGCDPLAEDVVRWWKEKMQEVYREIPNLGGFLVKADSEGRPGPFTYGRTHADGANMLAKEIAPYGGLIIWRCFVYNCKQDWRDKKTDRARAGYDNFMPLDGKFLDNVILQIKNGPMDFQVREPISPLFGGLRSTNQMLEVQIAQEYTGQQRHVCYLVPMWKEALDFHTYCKESDDRVQDIIKGKTFGGRNCGMAGVANTGDDPNWTGHDLAAANLYGFGRLSFDNNLSSEEIAREWISMTFPRTPIVMSNLLYILMNSWSTYEHYTSPLGIGWMVNPSYHYGPNVDGYEYDRWGTYHRADCKGIGIDRTSKGTGYSTQYQKQNAMMYEDVATCPDELLLFFHRILYTDRLKSGKTLIQHIYDTHFEGVEEVKEFIRLFCQLEGVLSEDVFQRILNRLTEQLSSAEEWRDVVNTYFYRKSGIEDEKSREIY